MIIKSMTATFGKLENKTMTLQPGLNIIEAPNEWGKSTWCAFLAAMLYGLDTRAKSTKTTLADKARYQPWSGAPMAGRLEIHWQGRDITIERRTKGRIPLGDFRAYETVSGLAVPELTAANCGQVLLGVEKSVFLRSALIRQSDLPVEGDEVLRRRLQALVTTGDEHAAGEHLAQQLRDLKNRCRYHRTGLLPQAEEERAVLEEQITQLQRLETAIGSLEDRQRENRVWMKRLENHGAYLTYQAARADAERVNRAREACLAAENRAKTLENRCENLPSEEKIHRKLAELEALRARQREAERKANARKGHGLLWLGMAGLASGILLAYFRDIVAGAVVGVLGLGLLLYDLLSGKHNKELDTLGAEIEAATDGMGLESCRSHWEQAGKLREALTRARQDAIDRREHYEALRAMAKPLPTAVEPEGLAFSQGETLQKIREAREEQSRLESRRSQYLGRMEALGDRKVLEARLHPVNARIQKLEQTYTALTLAQETLAEASAQLQRRFAPRIAEGAARRMGKLTHGRYDRLSLNENLGLLAGAEGEETLREANWRSDGTVDQLYLALRLSVAEALIPAAPLILDDALVRFDDSRLKAALEMLGEEAERKQVILFTCQSREKLMLNPGNPDACHSEGVARRI